MVPCFRLCYADCVTPIWSATHPVLTIVHVHITSPHVHSSISVEDSTGAHGVPRQKRNCYRRLLAIVVSVALILGKRKYCIHVLIYLFFHRIFVSLPRRWSLCSSLTTAPGGPVDGPVNEIARRLGVQPEQVLIAWVKSKGAVVLTFVMPRSFILQTDLIGSFVRLFMRSFDTGRRRKWND